MKKKKILIVEDLKKLNFIFAFDLQRVGFSTFSAETGEEGLQIARKEKPDLILLDVMLPGINGFEACRRLKSSEETRDIPIIIITAKFQRKDWEEGIQAGAAHYLLKPFKFEKLLGKIEELIGSAIEGEEELS